MSILYLRRKQFKKLEPYNQVAKSFQIYTDCIKVYKQTWYDTSSNSRNIIWRSKVHKQGTWLPMVQGCQGRDKPFLQNPQTVNRGDHLHASSLLIQVFVLYHVESKQRLWPCISTPHYLLIGRVKEKHRYFHWFHDICQLALANPGSKPPPLPPLLPAETPYLQKPE